MKMFNIKQSDIGQWCPIKQVEHLSFILSSYKQLQADI